VPTYKSILILTGAGLSAESGVATFRDPDGIWAKYDLRDVATPEGFRRNPKLIHDFYNMRRRGLGDVKPNAAHIALAQLEREHSGVTIITQNIDNLHEAAGSNSVIHMHGELHKAMCATCDARHAWTDDITLETMCPACTQRGGMRPDVVWFGEVPYHMETIAERLSQADLFISIGTSGHVYPAAGFVAEARHVGIRTVELNLERSENASLFNEGHYGRATEIVPAFVADLLKKST
jgi:NAD-dependent deacetylase